MSADTSHIVATAAAKSFAHLVEQNNLDVGDALVALEIFMAISVIYTAIKSGQPQPRRYASEILDIMTENSLNRINHLFEKGLLK
jgi:hypothetical protein